MLFDDLTLEEVRALDRRDAREEGRRQERERIFGKLVADGMSPERAAKYTGLTPREH